MQDRKRIKTRSQDQCCGSGWFSPGSEFFLSRIPDPHQRIKVKIVSKLSEIWMLVVHPGSRSLIFYLSRIRNPGDKKTQDPGSGSASLARTEFLFFRQTCSSSSSVISPCSSADSSSVIISASSVGSPSSSGWTTDNYCRYRISCSLTQ